MNAEMRWGWERAPKSLLSTPKQRSSPNFSFLEGNEHLLPEVVRRKFSPEMIRKAGKIVHVRFE
jgi:hypothetical protein